MIRDDTHAYRRNLPHLEKQGKTYFITFGTFQRAILPPSSRTIALECCLHDNDRTYWLHCAVVMPDHAHLLLTPLDGWLLATITSRIKSVSSHFMNKSLRAHGHRWQHESFDHIVRSDESLVAKAAYICDNPVRAGLVANARDYPWTWNRYWL